MANLHPKFIKYVLSEFQWQKPISDFSWPLKSSQILISLPTSCSQVITGVIVSGAKNSQ